MKDKPPKCRKCGLHEVAHIAGVAEIFDTKLRKWIQCTGFVAAGDGQTEPSGKHKA